jgi:hypothetical protein
MLAPEEFGAYLAAGTRKQPHGQAMYFHLRRDFDSDYFNLSDINQRCVRHPDGEPKHSVYLAIYRVLEHVPLEAIGSLWLVTAHGRPLELKPGVPPPESTEKYHLYREICPVHPLIASSLAPVEFCRFITDASKPLYVPKICFVELALAGLADDPSRGSAADLPYHNVDHIRSCLAELGPHTGKRTKTVDRVSQEAILYRCVKSGFFVGDQQGVLYYHYPTRNELEGKYHWWWQCANDAECQQAGWSV